MAEEWMEGKRKCPRCGSWMDDIAGVKVRSRCRHCGFYEDCC